MGFGDDYNFSMKELYDVTLKATYNLEIGGRTFEEGEVIADFDNIIISNFQEIKSHVEARGGFDNRAHVNWDETKEVQLSFTQGVFSNQQFALLSNSKLLDNEDDNEQNIFIPVKEELESDENGRFTLKESPYDQKIFCYDKETGEKIVAVPQGEKLYNIINPYKNVIVRYNYKYTNGGKIVKVGRRLIEGYLRLEGKTRLKDDNTGQVVTGLIVIPRLKLMSDLSMRLGIQANPVVANFEAKAYPVGERGNKTVIDFVILNDDVDADM